MEAVAIIANNNVQVCGSEEKIDAINLIITTKPAALETVDKYPEIGVGAP